MTFSIVYIIINIMTRKTMHLLHFSFDSITDAIYFQSKILDGASFKELKKYIKEQHNKSIPIAEVKKLVLMMAREPIAINTKRIEELRPILLQRVKELFN